MGKKRVLVICAHDDDEIIACGGTIRKLSNAGAEITTLIFATGNEGYTRIGEKNKIAGVRQKERKLAQKIIGTSGCITYKYHDFDNLDCEDVYRAIIKAVRQVKPHIVFTHYPAEYLAHRTLASTAPEAVMQAGWDCSAVLGKPWKVENIYQFTVLDVLPDPTCLIDISDTFDSKKKAMMAYRSQVKVLDNIIQAMEGKALYYGSFLGVKYAEAFCISSKIKQAIL